MTVPPDTLAGSHQPEFGVNFAPLGNHSVLWRIAFSTPDEDGIAVLHGYLF